MPRFGASLASPVPSSRDRLGSLGRNAIEISRQLREARDLPKRRPPRHGTARAVRQEVPRPPAADPEPPTGRGGELAT